MADTFTLKLYSSGGLEFEGRVESVYLPSAVGEIGFLPQHCDYVGVLDVGVLRYTVQGKESRFVVTGGLCKFSSDTLTVLADQVDAPNSVSSDELQKTRASLSSQIEKYSLYDPEWTTLSQQIGRIEALEKVN